MFGPVIRTPLLDRILTGEIAIEVTGVVGVSPALWYFRYIASIFFLLYTSACDLITEKKEHTDHFLFSYIFIHIKKEEKENKSYTIR